MCCPALPRHRGPEEEATEVMHPFTHFLPLLIVIIVGTTALIAAAIRLFFRRGMDALDI